LLLEEKTYTIQLLTDAFTEAVSFIIEKFFRWKITSSLAQLQLIGFNETVVIP